MEQVTASDFAHFYVTQLLKVLKKLERRRRLLLRRILALFFTLAALFSVTTILAVSFGLSLRALLLSLIVWFGLGSFAYKFLTSQYVHEFKLAVIEKIIKFIHPNLTYWPNGHISRLLFNASRIFPSFPEEMEGDDLVEGRIGETYIQFSEVHARSRGRGLNSTGAGRSSGTRIFDGLFFVADFNKKFYGKTVVLPDTAERLFGGLGTALQSLDHSRGELIKLDDPEFEKYFVVYGDDQIESRYVLSPSLMERIVKFRKKTGKRLYISFVSSQVFIAIPYRRKLFEPPIFSSVTSFENAKKYFEDLELALGIVEDLNLNTRIWKEKVPQSDLSRKLESLFLSDFWWKHSHLDRQ